MREKGLVQTLRLIPSNLYYLATDFDVRHGTDTGMGGGGGHAPPEAHEGYEGTKPRIFHRTIRSLKIHPQAYTFVDLGSGKGRALLLASHYPFRRIIGVEYLEDLHNIAARNIKIYRARGRECQRIETVCGDAGAFPMPEDALVIYMNNPFKAPVMERVLGNLRASLETTPRDAIVIYQNPLQRELLDNAPFLELQAYRHHRTKGFRKMPIGRVAVYRACAPAAGSVGAAGSGTGP